MTRARAAALPRMFWLAVAILVATVIQLLVGTFAAGLPQFEGKGFGARLFAYPAMMLVVPALWALMARVRRGPGQLQPSTLPWAGFALIMAPFLVDVTGNTANLYDTIAWWDDVNHLVNWCLLCGGIGLLLVRVTALSGWVLGLLVTGIGAVLALGWELGEWYTFIRHGTELATAYEDTLGDQALGTVGAAVAGVLVARAARRRIP